jgi:hypothetical protein
MLFTAFSNPEFSPDEDITIAGYIIPRQVRMFLAHIDSLQFVMIGGKSFNKCKTNVIVDSHAINVSNPFWIDGTRYNPARHFTLKKEQVCRLPPCIYTGQQPFP